MHNSIARQVSLSYQEKMSNTVIIGAANFLMLMSVFPYISPVNLGFDTQPFALMLSMLIFALYVLKKDVRLTMAMFTLLMMFLIASCFTLFSPDMVAALRSVAGYATLFFVTFASYRTSRNIKTNWFNASVYLWFSVGIIQFTVSKTFGGFLLPRLSTSDNRGVTSLAVEPSYYAIICVFLLLINDFLKSTERQTRQKHRIIMGALILQIILTFSGLGFVFLFVYMMSKFVAILAREGIFKHKGKLLIIALAIVATFTSFRSIESLQQSRAGGILEAATVDPRVLLLTDQSIADRLSHAILPIYSLSYSSGIGLGMGTWSEYLPYLRVYAGGFVNEMSQYASVGRIMSGWGTAIYELGILGLIYPFIFIWVIRTGVKRRKDLSSQYLASGITIFLLMFMAVPLAFPLFSYLLGMFMYHVNEKQNL